ncbi:hypothetical protein CKO09_02935 [Chromatium weissei]|nr:hypothetical protein [Chromatium weissei]
MAFTSGNDFNILQSTDLDNVDAGAGDDVYIVTAATLEDGKNIQIIDHQGNNTLQLVGGLEIASSIVAANTLALTLTNGSVITVNNANTVTETTSFSFEPGGNITTGTDNVDPVDYTTFATTTLGVEAVPEEGTAEGGAVTIEGGGSTDNQAPTATDDNAVTDVDTPVTIDVLTNDSDPEGDTLTITGAVANADNGGSAKIVDVEVDNGDGTTTTVQQVEYTPATGFTGSDTVSYTIDDGNGNEATGTVTVTVGAVVTNGAPTAKADTSITDVNTAVTIDVLANDTDPDEGDALTITGAVANADNGGSAKIVDVEVDNGDGTTTTVQQVEYTPATGFTGSDTVSYTIDDGNGNEATGTVTVEVKPVDSNVENVSAGNTDPFNAADGDFSFAFAAGNYTYNITGFGVGDVLDLPDAFFATADGGFTNNSGTDGNIIIKGDDGAANVITINLTGIATDLDTAFNVATFNSTFGDGSLI